MTPSHARRYDFGTTINPSIIMPTREPKSTHHTTIQIVGRSSERKGRLDLSSGSVAFFRKKAQKPIIELTYQQLAALLEREVEYREIDESAPLPKGSKIDFWFQGAEYEKVSDVQDLPEHPRFTFDGSCPLSRMDSRRVDQGQYSLTSHDASSRSSKRTWYASISIPLAISIIGWYIDKFIAGKRTTVRATKDIVIAKAQLRRVLLQLIKRLDS